MPALHLRTGSKGERVAESFLRRKGFAILARNWRKKQLELDIIARDGDTLVFVEVKTRHRTTLGEARESVSRAKQGTLCRAASAYLSATGSWDMPCRFDVVAVEVDRAGETRVEHVENAFSFDQPGAPNWQPF